MEGDRRDIALVIPTNRPEHLREFLEAWRPWPWTRTIVVEDGPEITCDRPPGAGDEFEVHSWAEIDAAIPEPEIISRRDSAIRAFGFWVAWRRGAEVVFTLDDDCLPAEGSDLVAEHLANLEATPAWQSTVPGLRVRGLPYRNLGTLNPAPALSVGLWTGIPDLDAINALAKGTGSGAELVDAATTRVMAPQQLFPMSGMNLALRGELACLMYYPPMGEGSPYRRFDDIWCGLVVQRVCRHLGLPIVCGRPFVEHRRASNPFANLEKEAAGVTANERAWELVDSIELSASEPLAAMRELGRGMREAAAGDAYFQRWGAGIQSWCELFEGPAPPAGGGR
jgi:reversibly glycosylated polypeptide / UDP-arabinopyranose mutase